MTATTCGSPTPTFRTRAAARPRAPGDHGRADRHGPSRQRSPTTATRSPRFPTEASPSTRPARTAATTSRSSRPTAPPTTAATTVVNARTAHGGSGACHVNNIEYSQTDDALVFSDLDNGCLTKVDRNTGATIWVLNGGSPASDHEHLHRRSLKGRRARLPPAHRRHDILLFNNNSCGRAAGVPQAPRVRARHVREDLEKDLVVPAQPGHQRRRCWGTCSVFPNGNTIIDFGTGTKIQEVDENGTLLQQIAGTVNFGFMEKRATLYGPSTK